MGQGLGGGVGGGGGSGMLKTVVQRRARKRGPQRGGRRKLIFFCKNVVGRGMGGWGEGQGDVEDSGTEEGEEERPSKRREKEI